MECCDIISNQFSFRYDNKSLSDWTTNHQTYKVIVCILTKWNKYLTDVHTFKPIDKLVSLGVMLYGFREGFLNNSKYTYNIQRTIDLFINNILIYGIGLTDIGDYIGKLTKTIYLNLLKFKSKQ